MNRARVLVLVPTYNERRNLPVVVEMVMRHEGYDVMVLDDGSPDGTGAVADELADRYHGRVTVVHRTGKRGLGRSYIEGLMRARAGAWDYVCQMDADLSHDPAALPNLLAAADAGADLVIGSRYLHGVSVVNWPLRRLILSTFANRYVRTVTRLPVRDCTSGFRCWRRQALECLPLESMISDGYAFLVELLYSAFAAGLRITEVPIVFVERREGESKLDSSVVVESILMPFRVILRTRRSRRRSRKGPLTTHRASKP